MSSVSKYSSFTPAGSPSWVAGQVPNWQGGAFDGWRHVKSVFAVDFVTGQAMSDARGAHAETCLTVKRTSPRYFEGDDGVYHRFDADKLVTKAGKGAFIFGTFANKIRNPRGEGGTVGTVGVTNKCTGYNAAPPVLVAMTNKANFNAAVSGVTVASGDANSLAGIADDLMALEASTDPTLVSLTANNVCNGRVVKIDNSGSAAIFDVIFSGATDGANSSISAYIRGSGNYRLTYQTFGNQMPDQAATATYARVKVQNQAAGRADNIKVRVAAGAIIYVTLWQLEQGAAAAPVPTVVAGASAMAAMPTYTAVTTGGAFGVSYAFLGHGIKSGEPYVTVRVFGQSSGNGAAQYNFDVSANAQCVQGQAWGLSASYEVVEGVAPRSDLRLDQYASSSWLGNIGDGAYQTTSDTKTYVAVKGVVSNASASNVRGYFNFEIMTGVTYDFTINIYAPKLVQLAALESYLPTYPILPPVGVPGDVTSDADIVQAITTDAQPFPRWEVVGLETGGGVFVDMEFSHVGDGAMRPLFEISDGSVNNYIRVYIDKDDRPTIEIVTGNVVQASAALAASVIVGRLSIFCVWTADGGYICDKAGRMASFGAVFLPTGLAHMQIGGSLAGAYFNDALRQIQVCLPLRQSEAAFWAQVA